MTSIITTIEQDAEKLFLGPIETWAKGVETAVVAWAKSEETAIVDDFEVAEAALLPIWTQIGPGQWAILQGLVTTAQADVKSGDYGDLVTDVLNQAAAKELAWVGSLGTAILTVILAALHLQANPAPAA